MNVERQEVQQTKESEPIPMFVLSWDVNQLMEKLCAAKGWLPPTAGAFGQAKSTLVDSVSQAFGASQTVVVEAKTMADDVEATLVLLKAAKDIPIVTMDPLYSAAVANFAINTTRGMNADGTIEEVARPGYPDISIQLDTLSESLNGSRSVYLADAGAYSGGSMKAIIGQLQERSIDVDTVILGIATTEAERALSAIGIRTRIINNIRAPIDWIEARDFVPFVPLCGRVINETPAPSKLSSALPYLLPEGNPLNWASVPKEKAAEVSIAGWNAAEILFRSLEAQNGMSLSTLDLIGVPIRVSYPGAVIPGMNSILDIIRTKRQMIQYRSYEDAGQH